MPQVQILPDRLVPLAVAGRRRVVVPVKAGSIPVRHPIRSTRPWQSGQLLLIVNQAPSGFGGSNPSGRTIVTGPSRSVSSGGAPSLLGAVQSWQFPQYPSRSSSGLCDVFPHRGQVKAMRVSVRPRGAEDSAAASGAAGRPFESGRGHGRVAQRIEHGFPKPGVARSSRATLTAV
jgi:hypothetical protein